MTPGKDYGDLQQHEAERLSLIRYQLLLAEQQMNLPSPLNSMALGTMQDAVESMFSIVIEHRRLKINKAFDFIQLFDSVNVGSQETSLIGGFRSSMIAMNNARVNFKHHGNQADISTILRHLSNSTELIAVLTSETFGIEIRDVSLLLFVSDDLARKHIETSEELCNTKDLASALDELKLAFDRIVRDYDSRKSWAPGRGLFSTKPSFLPSVFERKASGKTVEKAFEWLESLDDWVKLLALGVDMRRYAFFNAHAPHIMYSVNGAHHISRREGIILTEEIYSRCLKFVIDTALAFREDDFDFDAWAVRQTAWNQ